MLKHLNSKFEDIIRRNLPESSQGLSLCTESQLPNLGLDSFRMVSLLVELEKEYSVTFPDEALEVATFASPGTLWSIIGTIQGHIDDHS
jgi:acyl carrier protein